VTTNPAVDNVKDDNTNSGRGRISKSGTMGGVNDDDSAILCMSNRSRIINPEAKDALNVGSNRIGALSKAPLRPFQDFPAMTPPRTIENLAITSADSSGPDDSSRRLSPELNGGTSILLEEVRKFHRFNVNDITTNT